MRTLVLLLAVVTFPSNPINAEERDKKQPIPFSGYYQVLGDEFSFTGATLVVQNGKVIAEEFYGNASENVAIDENTIFEIASVTKPFTATAVMILAEDGKLSIDDPIRKWLPEVPESCESIKVRHLLNHTSGIPGTNAKGGGEDFDRAANQFFLGGPRHEPGTHYSYWNQGYAVLSEVIARASGKSYTDFIRERIFRTCEMSATCFTGDDAPEGTKVAVGFSMKGASRKATEHPYGSYGFQYRGMGGIVTNPRDLSKFVSALQNGTLISKPLLDQMWTESVGGYGLGWKIQDDEKELMIKHGGKVRGFLASLAIFPDVNGYAITLSNSDFGNGIYKLHFATKNLLYEKDITAPTPPPRWHLTSTSSKSNSDLSVFNLENLDLNLQIRGEEGFQFDTRE